MKIAYLSFDFAEYSVKLTGALAHDSEVLLLLPVRQVAPQLSRLSPGVKLHAFHKPRYRQPLQQLQMIYSLVKRIKEFNPDVIHFQAGDLWFNLALPLLGRYPLVITIHDPIHHAGDAPSKKTPQWVLDFGYRRANQAIVHGERLKQMVVSRLGIPARNVHVVPMIALGDTTAVQPDPREEDHSILFYGRIWQYKGLEYLIRAEPLITAEVPEAKIVIAGQGEDFARYRSMMVHPERFVVHNEYVSDEKTAELFAESSVVVLPYTEASQSGVIPIAYTHGKPVVATRVGGLPEMVEDGKTGYLVPPRNEKELASAVIRLLKDEEQRRKFGANGRRKIDLECSPEVVAERTLEVYYRAVGEESYSAENAA